jgi:hypothetical protein
MPLVVVIGANAGVVVGNVMSWVDRMIQRPLRTGFGWEDTWGTWGTLWPRTLLSVRGT